MVRRSIVFNDSTSNFNGTNGDELPMRTNGTLQSDVSGRKEDNKKEKRGTDEKREDESWMKIGAELK